MAVAGVVGGVGARLDRALDVPVDRPVSQWTSQDFGHAMASGLGAGLAGAATRSLINGSSFGDNILSVLPDVIGQTIGNMVAGGVQAAQANARSRTSGGAKVMMLAEGAEDDSTRLRNGDLRSTSQTAERLEGLRPISGPSLPTELWPEQMSGAAGQALVRDSLNRDWVQFWAPDGDTLAFYGTRIWPEVYGDLGVTLQTMQEIASRDAAIDPELFRDRFDSGLNVWTGQPVAERRYSYFGDTAVVAAPSYGEQIWRDVRNHYSDATVRYVKGLANLQSFTNPTGFAALTALDFTVGGIEAALNSALKPIWPNNYSAETMANNAQHPFWLDPNHIFTGQERRGIATGIVGAVAGARVPAGAVGSASRGVVAERVPTQLEINSATGRAFQARVDSYGADTLENFVAEVSIRPNTATGQAPFRIRADGLGTNPETQVINLLEAKGSATAPLTTNQTLGFPLLEQYGGTIVGNNGGVHYPAGTVISPGTGVRIIRPSNLPEGY